MAAMEGPERGPKVGSKMGPNPFDTLRDLGPQEGSKNWTLGPGSWTPTSPYIIKGSPIAIPGGPGLCARARKGHRESHMSHPGGRGLCARARNGVRGMGPEGKGLCARTRVRDTVDRVLRVRDYARVRA